MCGIAGIINWQAPPDRASVERMVQAMIHRGPDHQAVKVIGSAALGHSRLAIIDLDPVSNQPMGLPHAGLWMVFNGEIYNFKKLRLELEGFGVIFKTKGDAEVLLQAYHKWGSDCLSRLNGMFAFAIWDERNRRLFMARDRAGKKPLYYAILSGGGVVFSSELKALRLHPEISSEISTEAVQQYLSLGYTLSSSCILKNVIKLPAAHYLMIEVGKQNSPKEYWKLDQFFRDKKSYAGDGEATEALDELIKDAVHDRLVSDVPLGSFLSGGIDSSTIVSAMSRLIPLDKIQTYSIGFQEESYSELPEARDVANFLNVNLQDRQVGDDMARILPAIMQTADEPFADNSIIPFYYLAQLASSQVKVCLSGDGSDEFFAGYETYIADIMHQKSTWIPKGIGNMFYLLGDNFFPINFDKVHLTEKILRFLQGNCLDSHRAHMSWRVVFQEADRKKLLRKEHWNNNDDPMRHINPYFKRVKDCHFLDQAMYVDIKTWLVDDILVKVDRATMAHSLEARTPFLDYRIMEFAASLPVNLKMKGLNKKYLLKRSQAGHLPQSVLQRTKKGFNAPVSHWLNGELQDLCYEASTGPAMEEWFDVSFIKNLWDEHRLKRRDNGHKIFSLASFGFWLSSNRENVR